jgi:hypothetical protein
MQHAACSMDTSCVDCGDWNQIKCRGTSSAAHRHLSPVDSPRGRTANKQLGQARPSAADEESARWVVLVIPFLSRSQRGSPALHHPYALVRLCIEGSAFNTRYLLHWFLVMDRLARAGSTSAPRRRRERQADARGLKAAYYLHHGLAETYAELGCIESGERAAFVAGPSAAPAPRRPLRATASSPLLLPALPPLTRKALLSFVRYLSI